ncbi:Hpt domain-containing protein [Clostridium sp. MCC353]|uniref:Hpt domain-containing protein n=1 Tax=Clostridium sp. MCC353 TaxID=2592646 RepID=UPI001C00C993|nr:Hpt domain-containing protein [Clostridium sp. MCC353]MBT9778524.1 Hpt domain-containing protein [Clostridium sp. MCC353]
MRESFKKALAEHGVDVEGSIRRFCGNEGLYEKFLFKFLADDNFSKVAPAFEAGDYETALIAAHTLKGVSANLGINNVFQISSEIVNMIRAGKQENAKDLYADFEKAYEEIYQIIKQEQG